MRPRLGTVRRQGLYHPARERDSCGVGFVAHIKNRGSHQIVRMGLEILENLEHRGAVGANPTTGDGAGLLTAVPDLLLRHTCGFDLPGAGRYGVAMMFLPRDAGLRGEIERLSAALAGEEGVPVVGWRDVPADNGCLNDEVRGNEPVIRQLLLGLPDGVAPGDDFERRLFVLRRRIENAAAALGGLGRDPAGFCVPSMSSRTVAYKGMFLARQLGRYYPDLGDGRFASPFALAHQRFSTNTFPEWSLAHPYRMLAHNGEINTLRGNINNMIARERSCTSSRFGKDLAKVWPLIREGQSDSASLDNALELLRMAGYPLAHAIAMLIPEAWQGNASMAPRLRAFYEYHAPLMEPWDGPALVAFTDGIQIGATLDRNGLRPARYSVTEDDLIIMGSETGVVGVPDIKVTKKWRLQPGKMLLVDLEKGTIVDNADLKEELAQSGAYRQWVGQSHVPLSSLPARKGGNGGHDDSVPDEELLCRQQAFGYTEEDVKFILRPMVEDGQEAIGSMGDDSPQAVLSDRRRSLYDYFRQEFAQVTNPAIDPIREEMVMSLMTHLGERGNLLEPDTFSEGALLTLEHPALTPQELRTVRDAGEATAGRIRPNLVDITYPADLPAAEVGAALEDICKLAAKSVEAGCNVLVLTDRDTDASRAPLPALLALSSVHHRLVAEGLRSRCGIVVDTGSARAVHHFAVLTGYGADAVCPHLAYQTVARIPLHGGSDLSAEERVANYRKAIGKGILKVMSKMGVSTYLSYCGAQIFEAVGLSQPFVDRHFPRTITQIEGVGLDDVIEESRHWHRVAYAARKAPVYRRALDAGGEYAFRVRGERHLWTPESVGKLQHAVRANSAATYREYSRLVNDQSAGLSTLRGMLRLREAAEPLDLAEVEPASAIVRRFSTGAMSLGSLSVEAHTTLAVAMNRIGGRSNTGEGGEDPARFTAAPGRDSMRSSIKQVASGRFGVTTEYLVNSDMMQIKIAQGAKPGEGGQLPGHKVDRAIAKLRYSVPGVGLISPPPHHDIYSIEDIAQLIHDLKNVNPSALVSVKLVSRFGVGTVAAGVAKAKSDHITIAGHDGGTGASPQSSIKHAGTPWELGLSETHQTLVLNDLRGRVILQVDGQIKTGRDVVVGALLGADEFGFATAPLVAEGCIMMRKCHLNTCPVGIATQNPELRKKFAGKPEHVVNYFFFVAEEVRGLMASLGFRTFDEMIGRVDRLEADPGVRNAKASRLDLSPVLQYPEAGPGVSRRHTDTQDHGIEKGLDTELIRQARESLDRGVPTVLAFDIRNRHRSVGARLSGELVRRYDHSGLPDDTIRVKFDGSAGQSFGAFLAKGITFELRGDANDYTAKGISGGTVAIRPPTSPRRKDGENIIVGNTVLYGAIAGECYFRGVAGERFAVRNSGAHAVVEGSGDHCCEYMTGGTVVLLGRCGRNFAAGMSGGVAYVLDTDGDFESRCNTAMVDLGPLQSRREPGQHLGQPDTRILRRLLGRHAELTGSPKAREILDAWEGMLPRFVKVMPRDYRRALLQLARIESEMVA